MFDTALEKSFTIFGLAPAVVMVVAFVVVPLIFSVAVAFTNYSEGHIPPNNTVDWVGFKNFEDLLAGNNTWSHGLLRGWLWTLVWAFLATFTCYFGGLIVAVWLKEINFTIAPIFRFIFILL